MRVALPKARFAAEPAATWCSMVSRRRPVFARQREVRFCARNKAFTDRSPPWKRASAPGLASRLSGFALPDVALVQSRPPVFLCCAPCAQLVPHARYSERRPARHACSGWETPCRLVDCVSGTRHFADGCRLAACSGCANRFRRSFRRALGTSRGSIDCFVHVFLTRYYIMDAVQ